MKERGEVRDWAQEHWSASSFQLIPIILQIKEMFMEACQTQYFRYNILGYSDILDMSCWWLERLCSSAGLAPPKPGYKQQQQREEESAADGRWGGEEPTLLVVESWRGKNGLQTAVSLPPTHVGTRAPEQHMLAPDHQSTHVGTRANFPALSMHPSQVSTTTPHILVHQWHRLTLCILLPRVLFTGCLKKKVSLVMFATF